jgi:hypothetical protein
MRRAMMGGKVPLLAVTKGHFSAVIVGRELKGTDSLNGKVGSWTIPLQEIPKEARDALAGTAITK